ncbi:hypothetical protein D1872_178450 [compost metagenome]
MNQQDLMDLLVELSGISDFQLELKQTYSKCYWGRYFINRKLIRIYALDEDGTQFPDDILIREATHELAHHIQFYHVPGWERQKGIVHDEQFYEIHKALMDKAFGRNVPVKYSPIVERIVASRK